MIEKAKGFFEKFNLIFLAALAGIYVYSRNKYLGEISYYMHIDELRAAFESMSIARGEAGLFSAGSLYVLIGAIVMKLKGGLFSLKLFRLLATAAGLVGMVFSYLTVYEMKKSKSYAFLEALLVVTLPVFFTFQRTGISDHVILYIIPVSFYFLIKGLASEKKRRAVYIAVAAAVFALILFYSGGRDCAAGFSNVWENIKNFRGLFWDDGHPYNISSAFGTIYVFSLPILAIGIIVSFARLIDTIKKKSFDSNTVLWIYTVAGLIIILFIKDADVRTAGPLFFAITLFITEGLIYICDRIPGALVIETAVYIICFFVFTGYYYENFNSEVNNSADHEAGIVVDKSVGEAIKASMKELPDRDMVVVTDNFANRNLMIALYGNTSASETASFGESDEISFGRIRVTGAMDEEPRPDAVYIVNQYEHQDVIDTLTNMGWGNIYLKEYTICFMH